MKRIFLATDYFRPEPGGLEALFTVLARNWQKDKIEVLSTKTTHQSLTNIAEQSLFDQKEKYTIQRPNIQLSPWLLWAGKKKYSSYLRERIHDFHPEHILFGDLRPASCLGAEVAFQEKIPYSLFLNGNDLKNRLGLLHRKEHKVASQARNVFTPSRFLARAAHGCGVPEEKITVIPSAFESRWTGKRIARLPEYLHKRVGKKLMILGMGPFVPRKGLDILIKSYARLKEIHSQSHLVLVGSGPDFSFLNELIRLHKLEEHVSLTGFVDDAIVASAWKRADIFVQPGVEREDDVEGLGTVFMESAFFGVPVVAGRVGGVDEIVRHGVTGFVIEPGDSLDIGEKIKQLIVSSHLRNRFGQNASDIAKRDFDVKRFCSFVDMRLS